MSQQNSIPQETLNIVIDKPGPASAMRMVQSPLAPPGPGEVCLEHHAIGLNYIDIYHRSGLYPLPMPHGLGMEAAGQVLAVGAGVSHLKLGDRVAYASQPAGAYCQHRTMPASAVCKLPDAIDYDTGAAMMLKGLTVEYLFKKSPIHGSLQKGDYILFHAAAGGVGLIACQWARHMGVQLIGTAGSDEKCALALEHGASHMINYKRENFADKVREITQNQGVKIVYDSIGKDTFDDSIRTLARFGLMVSFGNASGPVPPIQLGQLTAQGSTYITRPTLFHHIGERDSTQTMVDELFHMVLDGHLHIPIGACYPLAQVQTAHQNMENRKTTGSCLLLPR